MADRAVLIARKSEVRRQIEETQRRLERERSLPPQQVKPRRIRQLEDRLNELMAQEYALRLAIDRSGRG